MLKIVKIAKEDYDVLPEETKQNKETMYLCRDSNGLCSIYIDGECYGEETDTSVIQNNITSMQNMIQNVNEELDSVTYASNMDILEILNS